MEWKFLSLNDMPLLTRAGRAIKCPLRFLARLKGLLRRKPNWGGTDREEGERGMLNRIPLITLFGIAARPVLVPAAAGSMLRWKEDGGLETETEVSSHIQRRCWFTIQMNFSSIHEIEEEYDVHVPLISRPSLLTLITQHIRSCMFELQRGLHTACAIERKRTVNVGG